MKILDTRGSGLGGYTLVEIYYLMASKFVQTIRQIPLSLRVLIILHWDGWWLFRNWTPYSRRDRLTFRIPKFSFDKKISYPRAKIFLIVISRSYFCPQSNWGFDASWEITLTIRIDMSQI